jgi:dihydroxyacetone kinase-like predicted kinase
MSDLITSMHPQSTGCRGLPWIEYAAADQNMSRRHRKASRPRQKASKHHTMSAGATRLQACATERLAEPFEDDVIAMTRAASATHYGAITFAAREALTSVGECRAGDVLGLADGDIVHIGSDSYEVAQAVIERMLTTGSELVTVVAGLGSEGIPEALETWLARVHPGIDMVVYDGGQPLWPLIIGVE